MVDEWNTWRALCKEEIAEERKKRGKKADRPEHAEKEEIEVWVDEVIEQIEEELLD